MTHTSFCREIMPSRNACRESLKSSILSCSNRATSALASFETCSYSNFASDARRSAFYVNQVSNISKRA